MDYTREMFLRRKLESPITQLVGGGAEIIIDLLDDGPEYPHNHVGVVYYTLPDLETLVAPTGGDVRLEAALEVTPNKWSVMACGCFYAKNLGHSSFVGNAIKVRCTLREIVGATHAKVIIVQDAM